MNNIIHSLKEISGIKKMLMAALMLFSVGFVSAQDLELVRIIEPDGTAPIENDDTISIRFEMRNNGPGILDSGETYSGQIKLGTTVLNLTGQPLGSDWAVGQISTVSLIQDYAMNGTSNGSWEVCAWINNTSQYGQDPTPSNDTACASYTIQDPQDPGQGGNPDDSTTTGTFEIGKVGAQQLSVANHTILYRFENSSNVELEMIDLSGNTVISEEVSEAGRLHINTDTPKGFYLIRATSEEGVIVKKVYLD